MNLKKHIHNKDVAALFLSVERLEDDGWTGVFKVLWFNIVNKNRKPTLIGPDEIKVTNLGDWKDYK